MKTNLILSVLFGGIIVANYSCSDKTNEGHTEEKSEVINYVSVDSLENVWDEAWNAGNVDMIIEMLDDDAIVFENEWVVRGKDSLRNKFVIPNSSAIKSITTTKSAEGASEDLAYFIGRYSITLKDSTPGPEGPFTIIWKKQKSGQWKVVSLHTGTDKK